MTTGIRVFCTERRAKGINFGQSTGVGFAVQLTGNGQESFFTKEVFVEIDFALIVTRQVFQIQRRHAEHFTGTFRIGSGDQRSRYPKETLLVEEAMQRLRQRMTYSRDSTNHVGTWTHVRHFTQILNAVTLSRHWIGIRIFNPAGYFNLSGLNFKALSLSRRCNDFTRYDN